MPTKLKFLLFVVLFSTVAMLNNATAQNQPTNKQPMKIEIKNSNTLEVNETLGPDVKILRGDVEFYHDSSTMYCDSAYYNTKENQFQAFGRVHIMRPAQDGDTINLWGDSLHYSGATKYAKMRKNVKMTKDSMVMLTEHIDYDMSKNVANYFDGGTTFTGEDTLISDLGYFYPKTNDLVYNRDVVVKNPKYTMYSDTLTHNIKTKKSTFHGPTEIIGEKNYLYSEEGWYNHLTDKAELTKNSYLVSKEHKLVGDTIYYDRNKKFGRGRSNVEIIDTAKNIQLTGNNVYYYEEPEHSLLSDSALMKYISKTDTLYLHADTIVSITDTITENQDQDTVIYRIIKGFHHVKLFRHDLQTMCDSLVYNLYDSIITMYQTPVIWNNNNQLTAKTIKLYTIENTVDMVEMLENAFIISEFDSLGHYNQIYGKNMVAYLDSNKITDIEVMSAANTIYYTDEDSIVTGMNQVSGENMHIIFNKKNKIDRIWFYKNPKGTLHPLTAIRRSNRYLDGFVWYSKHRPLKMQDIFYWETPTEEPLTAQKKQEMEEEDQEREEEARLNGETIEN